MKWLLYASGAAIIWGINYAVSGRLLERGLSPQTLYFIDSVFGACLVGLLIGLSGRWHATLVEMQAVRGDLPWLIVALIAATAAALLIFMSIEAKNATVASLIEVTYPLFTAFFAWALFRQATLNVSTIVGAALIFAGVIVVAQGNR